MAKKVVKIIRNSDDTITVRVGRSVEHVSMLGKSKGELFDYIKYALISKGVNFSDIDIAEMMQDN